VPPVCGHGAPQSCTTYTRPYTLRGRDGCLRFCFLACRLPKTSQGQSPA
jgi:hypothetical protein